jgi:uncharacterized membrane protein
MLVGVIAIAAGIAARFWGLETRTFWVDEAFSSLRISGHTYVQVTALFDGHVHPATQVASLQETRRGLAATIASVIHEEPQRGLVYYVAASLWSGVFGATIAAERAFSALFGTIGIALGFLLGRRAARSPLGGFVLAALIALSPFQIAYSQQVREYSLFADCILLGAWLLLRALELPNAVRWSAFGVASIFGLYVEPLYVFILLAAALVVASERPLERAKPAGFAVAAGVALASFIPLAVLNLQAASRTAVGVSWAGTPYAAQAYVIKWIFNIGATFFDAELANRWWAIALVPLLALAAYAVVDAVRNAGNRDRSSRLALALSGCTSLPFILADLVKQAHYEAITRYQVATWIGLELALALALTAALSSRDTRLRFGSAIAFAFVLACGATSVVVSRPYPIWWENNQSIDSAAIDAAIPGFLSPIIIAQRPAAVEVLALGRYLYSHDRLLLGSDGPFAIDLRSGPYYAFLPDATLKSMLSAHGQIYNVSPPSRSPVPALARDPQGLGDPKNALWKWDLRL